MLGCWGAFSGTGRKGFRLNASTGAFFGATDEVDRPVAEGADADAFLDALREDFSQHDGLGQDLATLTRGTAFDGREVGGCCAT